METLADIAGMTVVSCAGVADLLSKNYHGWNGHGFTIFDELGERGNRHDRNKQRKATGLG